MATKRPLSPSAAPPVSTSRSHNMRRAGTRRPLWPHYQYGFGNEFTSEALPGALPRHNNPQRCPYALYAEQISGSSFTMPRHKNRRTWMYRIRPSAAQDTVIPDPDLARLLIEPDHVTPERLRWSPIPVTSPRDGPHTFVEGLITIAGAGDPSDRNGELRSICSYAPSLGSVSVACVEGDVAY